MNKIEKNSFWGSIKGNIISCVAFFTVVIIAVTATINSVMMRNVLITDGHNTLTQEAENTGELINEWLVRQAYIVDTMKSGRSFSCGSFFSGSGSQHKRLVEGCGGDGRPDLYGTLHGFCDRADDSFHSGTFYIGRRTGGNPCRYHYRQSD